MKTFHGILYLLSITTIAMTQSVSDEELCLPFRRSTMVEERHQPSNQQGRPGKIGPVGPFGPKGDRGEPGGCACDPSEVERLNRTIEILTENLKNISTVLAVVSEALGAKFYAGYQYCNVGLKDGRVEDAHITASSIASQPHAAFLGRLDYPGSRVPSLSAGWAAGTLQAGEWIQVDLQLPRYVTGVITQGRHDADQRTTSYKVAYGNSTGQIQTLQNDQGNDIVFPGNTDRNTYVVNRFPVGVIARYFRVVVQTYHVHIALRFELITC